MKLLVITQKVDPNDDIMAFFHGWITKLSRQVDHLYVIGNSVGSYSLPKNVTVYSLGGEHGRGKLLKVLKLDLLLLSLLPRVHGVFFHMCPEYVMASYPVNVFFRKPSILWYSHVKVSRGAAWALKKVDYVFSASNEGFVFEDSGNKHVGTGHGIDVEAFAPPADRPQNKKPVILSVSRISTVKAIEVLIEAVGKLVHTYNWKNFVIRIVGGPTRPEDDEYLSSLQKQAKDLDVEEYIEWIGSIPNKDLLPYYHGADIFVRMQEGGGFGKNELEAMAVGLPAILPTPVYNEIFGEFKEDLYWEDGDAEALALNIIKVSKWSSDKRSTYSSRIREYVEKNHNLDNLVRTIVRYFAKILES